MTKWVYKFGNGKAEGKASDKNLLGGKGANLAEMSSIGIPVPPGFTISTEVCTYYYANGKTFPADLAEQVKEGVAFCESIVGKNSPIRMIRCCFPYVPAPVFPCRA